MHRRERYRGQVERLSDPQRVWSIDDAITENLDFPELLSDYLSQLPDAEECQRAFEVLSSLTVCDPTVGSGAFLFAALDVLEPLYSVLLASAEELEAKGRPTPRYWDEARRHPSESYWALKTICLRSLYGVDIMAEAPEVAKLRLFLKLAAQIERVEDLEPLPDLDFNIKCGNLLVGVRDRDDVTERIAAANPGGQLGFASVGRLDDLDAVAAQMADAYDGFVQTQSTNDQEGAAEAKATLLERSAALRADCDELLHGLREEKATLEAWQDSHRPFHWFLEFPSVWRNGGFDVIIGNPPYIQTKNVKAYRWIGYKTERCPDLYAVCVERATTLLNDRGRFAMIVMHNICFGQKYHPLRLHLHNILARKWISSYALIPSCLFSPTAKVRNSIVVGSGQGIRMTSTTRCNRWVSEARPHLFETIEYTSLIGSQESGCQWPFLDSRTVLEGYDQLALEGSVLGDKVTDKGRFQLAVADSARYFLGIYDVPPADLRPDGTSYVSDKYRYLRFQTQRERNIAWLTLVGRWGYCWWLAWDDEYHLKAHILEKYPCNLESTSELAASYELHSMASLLQRSIRDHLAYKTNAGIKVARYNMLKLRHITDRADWLLARAWGLSQEQFEAAGNLRDRMIFGNKE